MPIKSEKNDLTIKDIASEYGIEDVERKIIEEDLKKSINELLDALSPKERAIIIHKYGLNDEEPKTLPEIGKMLRIPTKIIKQMEFNALRKLGKIAVSKGLKEFLRE